ncbi:unnamed protein product [Cyprideis torosa]|uniref:Uncharacterized protein n=1 Tax=Cyprideis torosa TaxID=163714 RepID=A0A7R8WC42_9CRUS|nr:unnamed protein product [Cyprideis torosa]CAG0888028.1 unnamed protein product [Cyprideis torosa]
MTLLAREQGKDISKYVNFEIFTTSNSKKCKRLHLRKSYVIKRKMVYKSCSTHEEDPETGESSLRILLNKPTYNGFILEISKLERFSKAKHLQIVSGLRIWIYWLGVFIVQYFMYLLIIGFVIAVFHAHRAYEQTIRLSGEIFVVLAAEGFLVLPHMYFLTLLSTSVNIAFSVIAVILVILPSLPGMEVEEVLKPWQEVINVVFFLVTPPYAMTKSMNNLALNDDRNHVCPKLFDSINELLLNQLKMKHVLTDQGPLSRDDWCRLFTCSAFEDCFDRIQVCCPPSSEEPDVAAERARVLRGGSDGWNRSLSADRIAVGSKSGEDKLTMIMEDLARDEEGGLIMSEKEVKFMPGGSDVEDTDVSDVEDHEVAAERWRIVRGGINQLTAEGDLLIIKNATKVFPCSNHKSVDHICVGIRVGECFGLLGPNGAGKTTTMDMIAGYERLTE